MKRRPSIKPQDLISHLAALPPGHLFLTKAQMAGVLQVSVRCVTDMMKRGEIPFLKLRGRFVRFRLEDVQQHLTATALVMLTVLCQAGEHIGLTFGLLQRSDVWRTFSAQGLRALAQQASLVGWVNRCLCVGEC